MERASDDLRTRDSLSELIYHGLLEERIFGGGTLQQPEGPIVVTMTDKGLSLLGEAE